MSDQPLMSQQLTTEINDFTRLMKAIGAKVALEIGTGQCGTAVTFSNAMGKDSLVISVDLPEIQGGPSPELVEKAKRMAVGQYELVRGTSGAHHTKQEVVDILDGRTVDVLFVDAEHTEGAALNDYLTYKDLCSPNAIIGFHDILVQELWPMWCKLRAKKPSDMTREFVYDYSHPGCGIGVLVGGPV